MSKWYHIDPEYSQMSKADFDIRTKIVSMMEEHMRDMNNSYHCSPALGIPEDRFEDVAETIMATFKLNSK